MKKDYIIGIDLGTTTTEAAIFRNGKPEMIVNLNHEIVTPSVVGIDESGNFIIGEKAKAQYLLAPERTAIEIKRKLGKNETISLGSQSFSPVELSAKLLAHVKYYASQYLGCEVSRAVISVPAYFDDIQRQEVVEAGRLAGFTVERIINEPTAAALSYGINHMEDESHILIYDLGRGTFDVTLLELFEGVLEVKASSGNNQLGGKDFDEALIGWMENRFEEIHGFPLKKDPYTCARLKEQAEQCKIALSTQEEYTIELPFLAEKDAAPLGLDETVSRSQFEELICGLLESTHIPMQVVLDDSGISREELDFVLLAGGSTRIPLIARDIEEFLGIAPKKEIHPDYSIAEGTAIQAAIISGELSGNDRIIMTDVNPYTLGVRVVDNFSDDFMSVIIPRNVTIPVTRHRVYYTCVDGQSTASIEVYQGESRKTSKNHRLGEFKVTDIPYALAGEESVDVSFSYNQNGMLNVSAVLNSTGKEASISINMMDARDAEEKRIDVSGWKKSPISRDYRTVIRRAEKCLKHLETCVDEESADMAEEIEEQLYFGNTGKAIKNFERLIELFPEKLIFRRELAAALMKRGFGKKAYQAFTEAYAMGCRDLDFLDLFSVCCKDRKEHAQTIKLLNELIDLAEKNPKDAMEELLNAFTGIFVVKSYLIAQTISEDLKHFSRFLEIAAPYLPDYSDEIFYILQMLIQMHLQKQEDLSLLDEITARAKKGLNTRNTSGNDSFWEILDTEREHLKILDDDRFPDVLKAGFEVFVIKEPTPAAPLKSAAIPPVPAEAERNTRTAAGKNNLSVV